MFNSNLALASDVFQFIIFNNRLMDNMQELIVMAK